jgi:hypothetical protein
MHCCGMGSVLCSLGRQGVSPCVMHHHDLTYTSINQGMEDVEMKSLDPITIR